MKVTCVALLLTIGAHAYRPDVAQKFKDLHTQMKPVTERWAKAAEAAKKPPMPLEHLAKIPKHIKNRTHHMAQVNRVIPVSTMGGCGQKVRSHLKKTSTANKLWHLNLLETQTQLRGVKKAPEHPGRESFSVPGTGTTQTLADNGRDQIGTVGGEEPYVTVLKDGFFEVGCYHDKMLSSGDKFGNDKDKYKMGYADVSIALYDELTLDMDKDAMTPTICFEFCRTLPDFGYFGIANGRTCYCTPYYHPGPGGEQACNAPCEGDTSVMCGNMEGKSTIYEMHLCDTIQQELDEALTGAKEAMDYYMETALLAQELGEKMAESGLALEKAAGLSGAPGAADNAMKAKQASKSLTQAFMPGTDVYETCLAAYKLGKDHEGVDMGVSANAIAAEHATTDMKKTMGAVVSAAAATHEEIKLAYPVVDSVTFGDAPDGGDAAAMALQSLVEPDGTEQPEADFRVASYPFDKAYVPAHSSCTGPIIGLPMLGLGQAGCARACEATVYPDVCVAYSFYTVTGGDDLCFMVMDVETVETFTGPEPALLQKGKGKKAGEPTSAYCGIKMSVLTTGYKPKGDWKKTARDFGGDAIALSQDITEYSVPSASSLTLGAVTLEAAP